MENTTKDYKKTLEALFKDGTMETNELTQYLQLIIENIRVNTKEIKRNSYVIILCMVLFGLIQANEVTLDTLTFLSIKIQNYTLLLGSILTVSCFLYFKNILLQFHNNELDILFKRTSQQLFKLKENSEQINVLRVHSIVTRLVARYPLQKKLKRIARFPLYFVFYGFLFLPTFFHGYGLIILLRSDGSFILKMIFSFFIVLLLFFSFIQLSSAKGWQKIVDEGIANQ